MKLKKLATVALAAISVTAVTAFASCGEESGSKKLKLIDVKLTEEEYAFAIKKENDSLKTEVNTMLAEMTSDGSLDALINSYFDGTATFTYENKTDSPAADDFVVATNAYFPPFEYYEGNKFKGVDIELAYKIAEKLDKNLYICDMDFDAIIPSVAGVTVGDVAPKTKADIGMAGLTVTEERKETVDFASGYYESAQVLVVKDDNTEFDACKTATDVETILSGKTKSYKIGSQTATTGYMYSAGDEDFGYDGFPVTAKDYDNAALALVDLANGKINAVILDEQPAKMIVKSMNAQ